MATRKYESRLQAGDDMRKGIDTIARSMGTPAVA